MHTNCVKVFSIAPLWILVPKRHPADLAQSYIIYTSPSPYSHEGYLTRPYPKRGRLVLQNIIKVQQKQHIHYWLGIRLPSPILLSYGGLLHWPFDLKYGLLRDLFWLHLSLYNRPPWSFHWVLARWSTMSQIRWSHFNLGVRRQSWHMCIISPFNSWMPIPRTLVRIRRFQALWQSQCRKNVGPRGFVASSKTLGSNSQQ